MMKPTHEHKYAFILPEDEPYSASKGGAIATFTQAIVKELASLGSLALIVTPRLDETPYDAGDLHELKLVGGPRSRVRWLMIRALGRVFPGRFGRRERYVREVVEYAGELSEHTTIVVANDPALAASIREACANPIVIWLHNYLRGAQAEELGALPSATRVVTVSESVRTWTQEQCHVAAELITVIYNGVDHVSFRPPLQRHDSERLRVAFCGRIDPNKGQLLGAQAVRAAQEGGATGIELTVIGGLRAFDSSEEAAAAYYAELCRTVEACNGTMLGRIPATSMAAALREFDVALILPLVPEPFGLTAVEALASGCAVIAIPTGGVAEVVGDAALAVRPELHSIADALTSLATSRGLLAELQSRALVQSRIFSWRRAAIALESLTSAPSPEAE
ncbi:glycosyltransferase family 4 protein [Microbacterium horticulturae]|uniref:Glycosyltransferase family 4 protein n=1 Tax=Microbacterium horticulturae TaxID=3028316 RepID=A0ABY8BYB8_9MICO|nr:glycosyltransferase family 4 protein [Microbacterium sp. KACC 23027]WEG09186.1 glycosyltransferase family 4 protein [Microbacterium sp. KACC 23027]